MEYHGSSASAGIRLEPAEETRDRRGVLAVGDLIAWKRSGRLAQRRSDILFVEFHEINRDLLDRVSPSVVVSPLLCRSFDCVDLAQLLGAHGFAGKYRAIDSGLPDPHLIVREVRSLVPLLDFDIAFFAA